MRLLIPALLIGLTFAGCAGKPSMSENQCAVGDWQTVGYRDGVTGRRSTALLTHQDACMDHGVAPDRAAYMLGWKEGAGEYCQPNNGFYIGERGWSHNNICPPELRAGFLTAYQEGQDLYQARLAVSNLEWEIDQTSDRLEAIKSEIISAGAAQLNGELSLEERVQLGARVQRVLDDQARLNKELPVLEAELAVKTRELDKLGRTIALTAPQS